MLKKFLSLMAVVLLTSSLHTMQIESPVARTINHIQNALQKALANRSSSSNADKETISLKELETIFKASEDLLAKNNPLAIEKHPLYKHFITQAPFCLQLKSGPTIDNFTQILLAKPAQLPRYSDSSNAADLTFFNNAETFIRAFDIFKKKFEEKTGNSLAVDLDYTVVHTPLEQFCNSYIQYYPAIKECSTEQREQLVRLLSAQSVGNDIAEVILTLKAIPNTTKNSTCSFKPRELNLVATQSGSNDISLAQSNLDKQIQNLNGSELAMPYIKDADGAAQFTALSRLHGKKEITMVDIGGGRGETNALVKALMDTGSTVQLLNIEPHAPFAQPYIQAHKTIGVKDVAVWQQSAQQFDPKEVIAHFGNKKADIIFACHSLYFILNDMYKATQEGLAHKTALKNHPLYKYFDLLDEKGTFIITLQTGAGARLMRNALLGHHGLNKPDATVKDEIVPLLSSFGTMATFLRHFDVFAQHYQEETGKKLNVKLHYAVAQVPLGSFAVTKDESTSYHQIEFPSGSVAPKMLDFYGNWQDLQTIANITDHIKTLSNKEKKKLGIESFTQEKVIAKQEEARRSQETFLSILPVFAPGLQYMLHPNITLEIMVA